MVKWLFLSSEIIVRMRHPPRLIFLVITLFAIAMGFLESAVVVYLREIYYPEGFSFPLKNMSHHVVVTELLRELATMVMLVTAAWLCARTWTVRFAWFIYLFAVWDIFYYVFLWALLGWPDSLLTWDILFLIPTTWIGPVLAPVVNSLTMIVLAMVIIQADGLTSGRADGQASERVRIGGAEWALLVAGALVTVSAYIQDYSTYMLDKFSFSDLFQPSHRAEIAEHVSHYFPVSFNWWLFVSGELIFLAAIIRVWKVTRKFFHH